MVATFNTTNESTLTRANDCSPKIAYMATMHKASSSAAKRPGSINRTLLQKRDGVGKAGILKLNIINRMQEHNALNEQT